MMLEQPVFSERLRDGVVPGVLGASVNEGLYRAAFPGFNNATRYVRAYSALCWMALQVLNAVKQEEELGRVPDIGEICAKGLEKIELLLPWYQKIHGVTGVPGTGRDFPEDETPAVLRFLAFGPFESVDDESDEEQTQRKGAHFLTAGEYQPSIVGGLQYLRATSAVQGAFVPTEAGVALANAYEKAIAEHPWRDWLADLDETQASVSQVREMGGMLDLRIPSAEEAREFLKVFYPGTEVSGTRKAFHQRRQSLTLALRAVEAETLDAVDSTEPRDITVDMIRYSMARGSTRAGRQLDLTGVLAMQGTWANLQLRQYLKLALETLFRCVQVWIRDNPHRPHEIKDCTQGLGVLVEKALRSDWKRRVANLAGELQARKGEAHKTFFRASVDEELLDLQANFEKLASQRKFSSSADMPDVLRDLYFALVFCGLEANSLANNPHFQLEVGKENPSPRALGELVTRMSDATPGEFIAHIAQNFVIAQHFRWGGVSSKKYPGTIRYAIFLGDNGLENCYPMLNEIPILTDRLENALLLLSDCGLVHTLLSKPDAIGSASISDDGRAWLENIEFEGEKGEVGEVEEAHP